MEMKDYIYPVVDIGLPDRINYENISEWCKVLTLYPNQYLNETNVESYEAGQVALNYFNFWCATIGLILQLGGIPVFDRIKICSIETITDQSRQYTVRLGISNIGDISQDAYAFTLRASIALSAWMAQHSATNENCNQFYQVIKTEIVERLNQLVPSGKSTIPVMKAAHAIGIPYRHLGMGVYQLGWGSKARRLNRSASELDSAIGVVLTHNKASTARIMRMAGLPAPTHFVVNSESAAASAAERLGFPLVVKPVDRDRGEGVVVDISDSNALREAYMAASKISPSNRVIVERQVSGVCHRLFISKGTLLYSVKRHPMFVLGDGYKSVTELVNEQVERQSTLPIWERSEIQPIDDLAIQSLKRVGLTPESIPPSGMMAPLRRIESTEHGGIDENVTDIIHPDNLAAALDAVRLFGLDVAGVDFITENITVPWHVNGAVINEVNFSPLLGGASISRSYLPKFFEKFIDGDGKIPVEVIEDEKQAREKQISLCGQGLRCFFTNASVTLDNTYRQIHMPFQGIRERFNALITRKDVDAIILTENPYARKH